MGWKNIEKRFKIQHIVQIRDNRICIGSGYIGGIISISFDGEIIKRYDLNNTSNEHLRRYQIEMNEAEKTGELKELIQSKDTFFNLKPIYTHEKGVVIEKFCEEYDYPNVCTDGSLIYENTFFKSKKEAVKDCKHDCRIGAKYGFQHFVNAFYDCNKKMFRVTKRLILGMYQFVRSYFN